MPTNSVATVGDLLESDIEIIFMYGECARKHDALIGLLNGNHS